MIYGHARVSSDSQDLATQRDKLNAAGCEGIFSDIFTGTTADRPQLKCLMGLVGAGDTVIIPAVDPIARDPTDLLVLSRDLQQAGAGLRSIAESVVDTTSDFTEVVLAILGVAAKLERRRILDRKARGHAAAKARGVKYGRKPKLTRHQRQEALARKAAGKTMRAVARTFALNPSTISRLVNVI